MSFFGNQSLGFQGSPSAPAHTGGLLYNPTSMNTKTSFFTPRVIPALSSVAAIGALSFGSASAAEAQETPALTSPAAVTSTAQKSSATPDTSDTPDAAYKPDGLQGIFLPTAPINDPHCKPAPEHPNPVIFIHGTSANATNWKQAATALSKQGYCTWAFNYGKKDVTVQAGLIGVYGLADITKSVDELGEVVDFVRHVSGQDKVDLVGHSQGGTLTKMYIADRKQGEKVRRVVGVSATYHGTTLNGADKMLRPIIDATPGLARFLASTAATQQLIGSPVIDHLNSLPDTDKRVVYTNVFTPADTTATPNSTSQLESVDGASVANIDVVETCGLKTAPNHGAMPTNTSVTSLIKWGLTRSPETTTADRSSC